MTTNDTRTFQPHAYITRENKYPGTCCTCGTYVEARCGFYDGGNVWCEQPGSYGDWSHQCPMGVKIMLRLEEQRREQSQAAAARKYEPTPADIERNAKRAAEDARWAKQGLQRCKRCGGAGGASHWPGFTCYECGGHGATHEAD